MNHTPAHLPHDPPTTAPRLVAMLPDSLCWFRIVGSLVLVALAAAGQWTLVWLLLALLLLSDGIDGQVARRFSVASRHGALLDTAADVAMYLAILIATIFHAPSVVREYGLWIAAAATSYGVNVLVCLAKFRRWPSYHTRLSKVGWLFILAALLGVVTRQAEWLVLVAAIAVIVTNVESVLITLLLPTYRNNISNVFHVLN